MNCPKCRQKMLEESLPGVKSVDDINESFFFKGQGCAHCKNTGYQGRIAILEIIDVVAEIQEMILNPQKIIREERRSHHARIYDHQRRRYHQSAEGIYHFTGSL